MNILQKDEIFLACIRQVSHSSDQIQDYPYDHELEKKKINLT